MLKNRALRVAALSAFTASALILGPSAFDDAQASATVCEGGNGSGSFTVGAQVSVNNNNNAWRFRARATDGKRVDGSYISRPYYTVSGYDYSNARTANSYSYYTDWTGRWNTPYSAIQRYVNVRNDTNGGGYIAFDYERSCTRS